MILGIEQIASFLPKGRISNYSRKDHFGIDDFFIEEKIGIKSVAIKEQNQEASDLCYLAYKNLELKTHINPDDIECLVVVTQNPDRNIPHVSGILHGKLNLKNSCASFDISLGCSGYVYALSIVTSFMEANGMKKGLIFTSDPYSKIIDPEDKNTSLLFGDGASVTLISETPVYIPVKFSYGSIGKDHSELTCQDNKLFMNGRAIFNFAAKNIPNDITKLLQESDISLPSVDKFIFHQGSKYIIDTLTKRLKLNAAKVPFDAADYGNLVSSSIPVILEKSIPDPGDEIIVLSGFGVGLSWSSCILKRINNGN